jgi:Tfp pilus assembly protein PilO
MKLDRTQITYLFFGGLFLVALLFYFVVISPGLSRQKQLERSISKRKADLVNITELKRKWENYKRDQREVEQALGSRGAQFTLLSFLEGVTREVGIDKNIEYIKPVTFSPNEAAGAFKPEGIEMSLANVGMEQLVNFLYKVEHSGNLLFVKRIKILKTSGGTSSALKMTLQVNTYARS